jgi:hypothetical protein
MAFKLLDRAKMTVTGAPGTGNIVLGSPLQGYQSFSQAGVNDGDSFPYTATDGSNWEYGVATFAFAGLTLTREVTKASDQTVNPISLSSKTVVTASLRAEDIAAGTTLAADTDVGIVAPSNQQALVYGSSGEWVNQDVPAVLGLYASGPMTASEDLFQFVIPYAIKVSAGAAGSFAKAQTAATAATVVTITQNGTSVGTVNWAIGATAGTFTVAADIILAAGDVLVFSAPSAPDATLADVSVTLVGVRI